MSSFRTSIPEGSLQAQIKFSTRESRKPEARPIGESLGDEQVGLVQIDFQGHPLRNDLRGPPSPQVGGVFVCCRPCRTYVYNA